MRRMGLATAAALVVSLTVTGTPARGCSSTQPTFVEAIQGAQAIARVVVEDVTEYGEAPAGETFRVIRVVSGQLPDEVHLDQPVTGLCGDTIGYYAPEGTEVIVAFGVPFFGATLHLAWMVVDHPIRPLAGIGVPAPEDVDTLDELERLISATLPDTAATRDLGRAAALVGGVFLVLVAGAVLGRRVRSS